MKSRSYLSKQFSHLYKRTNMYEFTCTYCGMPCATFDHFPPLKHAHAVGSGHIIVPACKECNDMAGDSFQETLEDRINYVKDKIYKKYAHKFSWGTWNDPEVREVVARIGWWPSGCTVVTRGCTTTTRDDPSEADIATPPATRDDAHPVRSVLDRFSGLEPINKVRWRVRSATSACKRPHSKLSWEYPPIRPGVEW